MVRRRKVPRYSEGIKTALLYASIRVLEGYVGKYPVIQRGLRPALCAKDRLPFDPHVGKYPVIQRGLRHYLFGLSHGRSFIL